MFVNKYLCYSWTFTQQNEHCDFVDSWSRAPDQIQMYPHRDTIAQLLSAGRLCLYDSLRESLKI